jgi:hypothetical protein
MATDYLPTNSKKKIVMEDGKLFIKSMNTSIPICETYLKNTSQHKQITKCSQITKISHRSHQNLFPEIPMLLHAAAYITEISP